MNESASNSPITYEDVVEAIGDSDPAQTNANKVRALIGRGSFGTIQKHLEKLRAQRMQAAQPEAVAIPPAPPELLSMWGIAVAVATSQVRTRMYGVVMERDAFALELQSARGDVQALTDELERMSERLEVSETAAANSTSTHESAQQSHAQNLAMMCDAHTAEIDALGAALAAARHETEKTKLEAKVSAQALQVTIDRLTDQIGELKSLLHARG